MSKISKIIGTAGVLFALVPVAVFAQTTGKFAPAKDNHTPPTAIAAPGAGSQADYVPANLNAQPTLYEQGTGSQFQGAAQFGQRQFGQGQSLGGRNLMGNSFGGRMMPRTGNRSSRMSYGSSSFRPAGSVALRALAVLIGGITLILAWSVMFLLCAVLCKKLKMMGGCCKMNKKPEEPQTK
jgi:hypothetical protein